MARIYPLFSSSKGNCTYIGTRSEGILIDCGVTYKRLIEGMRANELDISAVKAVFVTHDHADHTEGLAVLTGRTGIPVYSTAATLDSLCRLGHIRDGSEPRVISGRTELDGFSVTAFHTLHDTADSCGYVIETEDGSKCGICTDLGCVTDEVEESLLGADLVLLESNYDERMLRNGSYPYHLKQRIASDHGHLSNKDSSAFVKRLIENGTMRFILGHLSEENNTPELASAAAVSALRGMKRGVDYLLEVAPVATSGEMMVY